MVDKMQEVIVKQELRSMHEHQVRKQIEQRRKEG